MVWRGVSKVYEQDQLDEDEHEGAHDAEVEPHCRERERERGREREREREVAEERGATFSKPSSAHLFIEMNNKCVVCVCTSALIPVHVLYMCVLFKGIEQQINFFHGSVEHNHFPSRCIHAPDITYTFTLTQRAASSDFPSKRKASDLPKQHKKK